MVELTKRNGATKVFHKFGTYGMGLCLIWGANWEQRRGTIGRIKKLCSYICVLSTGWRHSADAPQSSGTLPSSCLWRALHPGDLVPLVGPTCALRTWPLAAASRQRRSLSFGVIWSSGLSLSLSIQEKCMNGRVFFFFFLLSQAISNS